MTTIHSERRSSGRVEHMDGIATAVRIRPGHDATIVNVSACGILIETEYRLLPGRSVELQMETASRRESVRGRVVRCAVSGLRRSTVSYRGAIVFDRHLPWVEDEYAVPGSDRRTALPERAAATQHVL